MIFGIEWVDMLTFHKQKITINIHFESLVRVVNQSYENQLKTYLKSMPFGLYVKQSDIRFFVDPHESIERSY